MPQCEGLDVQLSAYIDGELEGLAVAGVEAHLKQCPGCAGRVERERRLRSALRTHLAPVKAPERLRVAVREAVTGPGERRLSRSPRLASWVGLAATVAVAVLVGREWAMWRMSQRPPEMAEQMLTAHLRSLQLTHLTDVAASDHHAVKPWFAGKLDYSPPVPDLDSIGFRLLGGRLDYVMGRPTAAVVYARRQHLINLFIWPAGDSTANRQAESERGYQSVHGAAGGLAYWAISDLNEAELREFVAAALKQ
jgi:anti-sigma factor RsiW